MNFYQSPLWYHINKEIYQKPTFEVELLGETYFGISKMQRKLGKTFKRYMVHGVKLGDVTYFSKQVKAALQKLTRDYHRGFGDLFFQLGAIDQIDRRPTSQVKKDPIREELHQKRAYIHSDMKQWYNLRPSWREHMPNATILLDLTQSADEMQSNLSSSGWRYVKKGRKADLTFATATKKQEREAFREVWYATSYDKGFFIPPKEQFLKLMHHLTKQDAGKLFLAWKDEEIVSGSVCLLFDDEMIYLYGATDRSFGSIGGHYWLNFQIMQRGHKEDMKTLDLLGVAAPGYEEGHPLQGVTRFKQSFGGDTVSYLGNYDLIFNQLGYRTFKYLKG